MEGHGRRAASLRWAGILLAIMLIVNYIPGRPSSEISVTASVSNNQSPSPADLNSTAEIESIILSIDEGLMARHIQELQDFGTRYSYRGDKCYEAAAYIQSVFDRNGLATYYDDFVYNKWKMRNVVGVKPGASSSNGTVIVCGHYDSLSPSSHPWTLAPGADDNGSGAAAVMAAAEILSDYKFNLTIKFIAFSGEEQGLQGSYHYVSDARIAGENITAVMNLDMIAYNPDPGATTVLMKEGGTGDSSWLKSATNTTAWKFRHLIGVQPIDAGRSGASDHHPFSPHYQAMMLIEQRYTSNPNYHKVTDTIDHLNMTYCANVTQLAVATVAELAGLCSGDIVPPAHTPGFPPDGSYAVATPVISIEVTDPSGVNASSLSVSVDGSSILPELAAIPLGYNLSHIPTPPFPDGRTVNVSVSGADILGNGFAHAWSFTVDAVPPVPPANFTVSATSISPVKRGTVIDIGSPWDIKHALAPSVIHHGGEYKMWYMASNSTNYHINYANSTDSINWVKHGTVLLRTELGQPDYLHVGYPEVMFDGEYKMWYSGSDGSWRIMYANSSDGLNWVRHGVVLDLGPAGSLDDTHASTATVVKMGEYKMWYTGVDGLKYSILYANSTDGVNWVKHNESVLPADGPGKRWGDAAISSPTVAHDGESYHMWYRRIGDGYYRTHYAKSKDGIDWHDLGLAIEAGMVDGTHDKFQAFLCSVLVSENETKVWYSGYNGANWRIMFANISARDPPGDLTLSWSPSPSSDVVRYEVFRETRPSAFRPPLRAAGHESYDMPGGLTPWTFEKDCEANLTVYGPVAGSDPPFFSLPDDNILDIDICLRQANGSWLKLIDGPDYGIDLNLGCVEMYTDQFAAGCTVHAWYNHSAGRALRVYGTSVADPGANSAMNYYYVIRAVDRAGNHAYCTDMPGKVGVQTTESWNLLGNPFLASPTPVEEVLASLDWDVARTWEPDRLPYHWTVNRPGWEPATLQNIDRTQGFWVHCTSPGNFAAFGGISNVSINLVAGWNLVAYPYHEIMSVSQALAGLPWDRAEAHDPASPTLLRVLTGDDPLIPGQGLWVRVTSDAVWNAVNIP